MKFAGRTPELDIDADDELMRELADGIQEIPKGPVLCPPQRFVLLCIGSCLRYRERSMDVDDNVDGPDIREPTQESSLLHHGVSARRVWDGVDRNGRELDMSYTLESAVAEVERGLFLAICEVQATEQVRRGLQDGVVQQEVLRVSDSSRVMALEKQKCDVYLQLHRSLSKQGASA